MSIKLNSTIFPLETSTIIGTCLQERLPKVNLKQILISTSSISNLFQQTVKKLQKKTLTKLFKTWKLKVSLNQRTKLSKELRVALNPQELVLGKCMKNYFQWKIRLEESVVEVDLTMLKVKL